MGPVGHSGLGSEPRSPTLAKAIGRDLRSRWACPSELGSLACEGNCLPGEALFPAGCPLDRHSPVLAFCCVEWCLVFSPLGKRGRTRLYDCVRVDSYMAAALGTGGPVVCPSILHVQPSLAWLVGCRTGSDGSGSDSGDVWALADGIVGVKGQAANSRWSAALLWRDICGLGCTEFDLYAGC